MKKVLLVSSSGGHFQQLTQIRKHLNKSDEINTFTITESVTNSKSDSSVAYFSRFNRKEIKSYFMYVYNFIHICRLVYSFKPDTIISTGAGFTVPLILLGKIFGLNTIYFESYAKIKSKTVSGRICYLFVDRFYVQWEEMLEIYPKAIYKGGLY